MYLVGGSHYGSSVTELLDAEEVVVNDLPYDGRRRQPPPPAACSVPPTWSPLASRHWPIGDCPHRLQMPPLSPDPPADFSDRLQTSRIGKARAARGQLLPSISEASEMRIRVNHAKRLRGNRVARVRRYGAAAREALSITSATTSGLQTGKPSEAFTSVTWKWADSQCISFSGLPCSARIYGMAEGRGSWFA